MNLSGLKVIATEEMFDKPGIVELGSALSLLKHEEVIVGDELIIEKGYSCSGGIYGVERVYFPRLNKTISCDSLKDRWALFTTYHINGNPDCGVPLFDTPNSRMNHKKDLLRK